MNVRRERERRERDGEGGVSRYGKNNSDCCQCHVRGETRMESGGGGKTKKEIGKRKKGGRL